MELNPNYVNPSVMKGLVESIRKKTENLPENLAHEINMEAIFISDAIKDKYYRDVRRKFSYDTRSRDVGPLFVDIT
jgi:hypothetical protein